MGRGLSREQRMLLQAAADNRHGTKTEDHVYVPKNNSATWRVATREEEAQTNSDRASVSRSLRRLANRGLLEREFIGIREQCSYTYRHGGEWRWKITDAGRKAIG
jgi:predicted transcriptional regulator